MNLNLNKVDKVWNEFSKLNNIALKFKERSILQVTQSHYLINYTNEIATFSFIGMLSKSPDGNNTNKTSIIIEYKDRLNITEFELESTSKISSVFPGNNTTEFEKNLLKDLQKFNGKNITLKGEFVRIDTEHIFTTISEFEHVADLTAKLKFAGSNA
jgi:hypothetical protein